MEKEIKASLNLCAFASLRWRNNNNFLKLTAFVLLLLALGACVKYDADPFDGEILPRVSGYSTGVTNDWIYFNLRTGDVYNKTKPNEDITEGEQLDTLIWDLAFCGHHMRTNSGTSGSGKGGALDLGNGNYEAWTTVSQLPDDAEWVVDTDSDVYVTYSQADWYHYLVENNMDMDLYPWFDPNKGPRQKITTANKLLEEAIAVSGPPMAYTPSYHTYVVRTADGERYFKLQIVNWYNTYLDIDDTGGEMSYYVDELE